MAKGYWIVRVDVADQEQYRPSISSSSRDTRARSQADGSRQVFHFLLVYERTP
jgi:uncharacterized protein (DUF1330 family)